MKFTAIVNQDPLAHHPLDIHCDSDMDETQLNYYPVHSGKPLCKKKLYIG
jgi:hypothetical protein